MSNAVDVGGIKAKIEVDLSGYNAGIDKAKAKTEELGAQGKKTAADFKQVESAFDKVGSSGEKIGKLTAQLDNVNAKIEQQKAKLASLKEAYDNAFNDTRKSKLQDQILKTEASLLRLTEISDKTAQKIWSLEDGSTVTGESLKRLTDNLKQLGLAESDIARVDQAIRRANPEVLRKQIEDVRKELSRLGVSSDEINKITKKLEETSEQAVSATDKIKGIESALVALGAGAAFGKLISEMREFVAESERMFNATRGLIEVTKNLGHNADEATKAVQDMAAKGFMSVTEAAQAYKTSLAMGLGIQQTTDLILAMADAAAYNRQAHYSWGESIVVAMEGIKNGNSTLTDSVGVTKNLSVMQEEYARSIGTTAAKLTDAQKVQAAYNGFLRESAIFAGNADSALASYTGTVAKYENEVQNLKASLGDAIKPLFAELLEILTPIIVGLAKWVEENKTLVTGLFAATTAVTGAVAALASLVAVVNVLNVAIPALRVALAALGLSLGPVGWVVAGLSAVVGGLAMYSSSAREAEQAAREMSEAQRRLNDQLEKSPLSRSATELKQLQTEYEKMTKLVDEYAKAEKDFHARNNTVDALEKIKEINQELRDMGVDGVNEASKALIRMKEQIDASSIAMFELNKAEYDAVVAQREHVEETEKLLAKYNELNAVQKLTNAQDVEMKETINALKREYPDLTWEIDEQGRARITNIDIISDQISAERDLANASMEAARARIQHEIDVTEANKTAIEAQIKNYQRLLEVMSAVAGVSISGPKQARVESSVDGWIDPLFESGMTKIMKDNNDELRESVEKQLSEQEDILANAEEAKKKMEQALQNLSTGEFINIDKKSGTGKKTSGTNTKKSGKSAAEIAADLRKKAYDADIATVRYQADMYDWSAEKQIAAYEKVRATHKQHLKETVEDERTMNLQLKRLHEDTVKSRFDFSAEWITQQERRMEESYKSEVDIAKMKLDAWARVRDRYKKDTDEYKRADEQMYQARKQLAQAQFAQSNEWITMESRRMEEAGKSEAEIERMKLAAWTRVRDRYAKDSEFYKRADEQVYQSKKRLASMQEKLANELLKTQKTSIEDAKKAELKAIEERKKAALSDYDERIKAIDRLIAKEAEFNADADYETKLAEKRARLALLESAVGPDGLKERDDILKEIERMELEHARELRKRELENEKQAYQDEKSQREQAFDREKADVEAKYDALKTAFEDFGGDVKTIESAISDFRVQSNEETNALILSNLDDFVREYNAKLSEIQAVSAQDTDLAEYNANKDAWKAAKARGDAAEMARLNARNEELRRKYGIAKDTGKLPSFDVGGVVPGPTGHPLLAMVHGGEAIFNQRQLSRLFSMLDAPVSTMRYERPGVAPQSIVNHIDMSVNDAIFEDGADVETLYSERERTARRLQTMGVKTV